MADGREILTNTTPRCSALQEGLNHMILQTVLSDVLIDKFCASTCRGDLRSKNGETKRKRFSCYKQLKLILLCSPLHLA